MNERQRDASPEQGEGMASLERIRKRRVSIPSLRSRLATLHSQGTQALRIEGMASLESRY